MQKLIQYLFLPSEVSPTEKAHVDRLNRVALLVMYLHIPVFMGVAYICETGPWSAFLLSSGAIIGPTIFYFTEKNHRTNAYVIAFTGICLGGFLVHFGQGPMQIEMHFYFFVLLALLAAYGNPAVNLVAAATASVHHFLVWAIMPSSMFNYDASIWVVVVHALFVILETLAAIFIARSFFDNVIGLEKLIAERTKVVQQQAKDMRLVLDHVGQGLVTITSRGEITGEMSRIARSWLGDTPAQTLANWIRPHDEKFAAWLELGLDEIEEDFLPLDVLIEQFPIQIYIPTPESSYPHRVLAVSYQPIMEEEQLSKILVVLTDVTSDIRRAETEALQKENLRLFELLASNASGFKDFYDEARKMMATIAEDQSMSLVILKRIIHTLKGNTAMFGLDRMAKVCGDLENAIEETTQHPSKEEIATLLMTWSELDEKVQELSGDDNYDGIRVTRNDIKHLMYLIEDGQPHDSLRQHMHHITREPCRKRLEILATHARKVADRIGRRNVTIKPEVGDDIRLDADTWAPFWSSIIHVLRNAIDHGIEETEERLNAGKADTGTISLRTGISSEGFVFEVEDDGRGIALDRLGAKAKKLGLSTETPEDVLNAVFVDGLTTCETVSETSGRGVGMAAVKEEASALGGEVQVSTQAGKGTTFRFVFPLESVTFPIYPMPPQVLQDQQTMAKALKI